MSTFSPYAALNKRAIAIHAAHAERSTAIHANDCAVDLEGLAKHSSGVYPVSGDMLAVIERGTQHQRRQRRKRAAGGMNR